jgi:hypothetical protein
MKFLIRGVLASQLLAKAVAVLSDPSPGADVAACSPGRQRGNPRAASRWAVPEAARGPEARGMFRVRASNSRTTRVLSRCPHPMGNGPDRSDTAAHANGPGPFSAALVFSDYSQP